MRVTQNSLLVAMLLLACLVSSALAQGGGKARRSYDPSTESTVKGTVEKVMEVTGKRGWNGIHLSLRTNDQTYDVHVGPSAYVSKNGFTFSAGDPIEVIGSKSKFGGPDAIVAREIKKGGKILTLRDTQGIPKWSGGWRNH
jgi:hypothetical protein